MLPNIENNTIFLVTPLRYIESQEFFASKNKTILIRHDQYFIINTYSSEGKIINHTTSMFESLEFLMTRMISY